MRQLRDLLQEAQQNGVAIGHFNVSDLVLLKAYMCVYADFPRVRSNREGIGRDSVGF